MKIMDSDNYKIQHHLESIYLYVNSGAEVEPLGDVQKTGSMGGCQLSFRDCQDWIFIFLATQQSFQACLPSPLSECKRRIIKDTHLPLLEGPGPQVNFCRLA